ncbi:MAG: hypothetical protein NVS3B20_22310 [Polyangiales bacterium]
MRLSLLSLGRALDVGTRESRFLAALTEAHRGGADHLVITGDLTEDGLDEQFEVLARCLQKSEWSPQRVTLVPGNHDAYSDDAGWSRALNGPLASYQRTSGPLSITEVGDAIVVACNTAFRQNIGRAAGRLGKAQLAEIVRIASDVEFKETAVVLAQHHGPIARGRGALDWLDGLAEREELLAILARYPNIHVLCGHNHRRLDRSLGSSAHSRTAIFADPLRGNDRARIFSASAVVDDPHPLRTYEVAGAKLSANCHGEKRRALRRVLVDAFTDTGLEV